MREYPATTKDNTEPLSNWLPLQQAESALAEIKLIRGLLNAGQSSGSRSFYSCRSGQVPLPALVGRGQTNMILRRCLFSAETPELLGTAKCTANSSQCVVRLVLFAARVRCLIVSALSQPLTLHHVTDEIIDQLDRYQSTWLSTFLNWPTIPSLGITVL